MENILINISSVRYVWKGSRGAPEKMLIWLLFLRPIHG